MVDPRSDRPKFRQIADDLREQIRSGELAAGSLLPSEAALVERYGTSQGTVRKALGVLRAEGLTVPQSGKGVFVKEQRPILRVASDRFARSNRLGNEGRGAFVVELERQGLAPRSDVEVAGPVEAPDDVAELLDLAEGEHVVSRARRMLADAAPVQLATSYVPWSIAEGTAIAVPDSGPGGIYARIEEMGHELGQFREEVGARPATPEEAEELQLDSASPVILVTRVAYTVDGRPVEVCQHVMNAERYRLTYTFPAT
jgi:GntR family transcriptional regulator